MSEQVEYIKISDIAEAVTKGTTPTTYGFKYEESGVNFVKVESLTPSGKIDKAKVAFISDEANLALKRSILEKGDILFSIAGALGRVAIVEERDLPANTNQALAIIRLKKEGYDNKYILYVLSGPKVKKEIKRISTIGAQPNLNLQQVGNLPIPSFPYMEQRKIASILSSVDETIEKTEAIIEQTEELKKGLMQQLLTKGIGHTKFKKTEIGEIPEEWEVVKVGELCKSIVPGRNKPKEFNGDIPWITISDIDGPYINTSKAKNFVSREEIERVGGKIIPPNSVIMTCVGTFGITAVVKKEITINQQLHAFVCPQNVNPLFLSKVLELQENYMRKLATQTTIPYLNKNNCNSIPVPLPSLEEQNKISNILGMQDAKLNNELKKLKNLEDLKQGLMQSLLTGKVRVKVDDAEVTKV